MLPSLGHEVAVAAGGRGGWDRLLAGDVRVVVSDGWIPEVDGLELCRRVQAKGGDGVYFILLSFSRVTEENRQLVLQAGADDFLTKPLDPDELGIRLHVAEGIVGLSAQVRRVESFLPICGSGKKREPRRPRLLGTGGRGFREAPRHAVQPRICPERYDREIVPMRKKLGLE